MEHAHPSWDEIFAFAGGEAPAEVASHVHACGACAGTAARIAHALDMLGLLRETTPTPALVRRTLDRLGFGAPASTTDESLSARAARAVSSAIREVVARLRTDSLQPSAALRGATLASPRMLVFETDELAISLSLTSEGDVVSLRGQVMPKTGGSLPENGLVLVHAEGTSFGAPLTELGKFRIDRLPRAQLRLEMSLGDTVVRLASPIDTTAA